MCLAFELYLTRRALYVVCAMSSAFRCQQEYEFQSHKLRLPAFWRDPRFGGGIRHSGRPKWITAAHGGSRALHEFFNPPATSRHRQPQSRRRPSPPTSSSPRCTQQSLSAPLHIPGPHPRHPLSPPRTQPTHPPPSAARISRAPC